MYTLYLTCVFLLIQIYQAQLIGDTNGNCQVQGISESDWSTVFRINETINDDDISKIVFDSQSTNIKDGDVCAEFFCVSVHGNSFKILPSTTFVNSFDGNPEYIANHSTVEITSKHTLPCTSGDKDLTFKIVVKDTNNHSPSFTETSYNYTLTMPMPPKIDITQFGTDIIVRDIDFSNTSITISSSLDSLICNLFWIEDKFSYKVQLQFSTLQRLTSTRKFKLTATDSGEPSRSTDIEVVFNIDETNSELPSFTKPSYLYDYDPINTKIVARSGQEVKLERQRSGLKCSIDEAYSKSFDDVDVKGTKIELNLKEPFDDSIIAGGIAQITVKCRVKENIDITSADVIIYFQSTITERVVFSKKKYSATYQISGDTHEIKMKDFISLNKSSDDCNIIVEKDWREYLDIKKTNDGWILEKKNNLNIDTLKYTEIDVVIELSRNTEGIILDDAFINLVLPNGENGVFFTEPFFRGDYKYDDEGAGTMDAIAINLNTNDLDIINCGLEKNEYSDYFQSFCSGADKLEIQKINNIPGGLLKTDTVPFSMWVLLELGNIKRNISTAVLLNLSYNGKTTSPTSTSPTTEVTPSTDTPGDCSHTAWIIAVIVLMLLLIVYIAATTLYYFRRLRNRNEIDYTPQPKQTTPKVQPRLSEERKYKNVSTRRPTGFIPYKPDEDEISIDSENGDRTRELNNNTNANKFLNDADDSFRRVSDNNNNNGRNVAFIIPPPPTEKLQ